MAEKLQSKHKIDLRAPEFQAVTREFAVERDGIDKDKRTVALSFASEQGVERWYGREILDISKDACDMSRLNNGGAVLVNHDWDDQVGVVTETSLDLATKKARCVVKFSRSTRGEEIFQDIVDGIRSLVSVGYIVRKMVLQSVEGDVETHRVTDWLPFEVSIVAVPADTSVGVGRSKPTSEAKPAAPAASQSRITMETTTPPVDQIAVERKRVKDINDAADQLAIRHPKHKDALMALARNLCGGAETVDSFNRTVLADILKTDSATPAVTQGDARSGLPAKDLKRYSILRAIRLLSENRALDGVEAEASKEVAKKLNRAPAGFFLPDEVVYDTYAARAQHAQRTLLAGSAPDGGYLVGQELLTSEFVEYLRNNTKVIALGGRYISGLVGDVTIPRQLTGATAYWVSETGSITSGSATFGQIVSRPRRIGTAVPYSKQFLAQSSLGAEAFVINDSDASIAVDLDRVAIRGTGGAEPLGILNLPSGDRSTSVSFGGAATWAKYLEFWSSVASNNALIGNPAYLTNPTAAAKAMAIQKFSTYGDPIWGDNGKVGVFRADWTTQILTTASPTANQVIFGDWSQELFMEWAGRDVVVDPYTQAAQGNVLVTIQRLMDVVTRRAKSFAISSDSGAQ